MTIRVDRAVTDVIPQSERPAESGETEPRFEELDRLREMQRRLEHIEARTRAECFHD